jgi:hypothetical protein
MLVKLRQLRALGLIAVASLPLILSACRTCDMMSRCGDGGEDECPGHAKVCEKPTVRALAHDLDHLESHIERYGSVTIQHPSVWGQARLTKHREDFEKQMALELPNFTATLNGAVSRSDQAYFTNAFALSSAASAKPTSGSGSSGGASSSSSSSSAPASNPYAAVDAGIPADAFGAFGNITRTPANLPALTGFSALAKSGITLEPSTYLNQKARFLNHLNELRRLNEGDDTADSPGYALNLIRVPVSILPGKWTERGHGAEVTITLKPYLSDELLPSTFRNLVLNDLLEVIGVPLTEFVNNPKGQFHLEALAAKQDLENIPEAYALIRTEKEKEKARPNEEKKADGMGSGKNVRSVPGPLRLTSNAFAKMPSKTPEEIAKRKRLEEKVFSLSSVKKLMENPSVKAAVQSGDSNRVKYLFAFLDDQGKPEAAPAISATKLRNARRPFPPSQVPDIFGDTAGFVTGKAYATLRSNSANLYWIHYPDVQGYLREELGAAYNFLAETAHCRLWDYCTADLVTAVHTRNLWKLENMREKFDDEVNSTTGQSIHDDVTAALAWAIIVEAALLNKQLTDDIREAAAAKGCPCPAVERDSWLDFYMPQPTDLAKQAFKQYVECRWPIIVFALDPVADQQNIADTFAQRREMQLAMSLAFVNGNISAKNMTRYARRLESQMEAVSLNNTVTGFSNGNETFGWRFTPRFQTPEIESNTKVFFRDLLIGDQSRDSLLKQRKLEPGQRECTAIVLMPSFVPYATVDVSSTWFKLTNPKCKDMTCVDAVKLSARVKAIDKCADRVTDADCYRDGELERLKKRAKQLETRLPLQNMTVQIPYENTLGGFAMFNTGITDLAPELYGWYGAPAIDTTGSTTLFLIGNHLSVFGTRVIAGGVEPTQTELLSRQVMKVTIPKGAQMIDRTTGKFPVAPPKPAAKKETTGVNLNVDVGLPAIAKFGIPDGAKITAKIDGSIDVTTPAPDAPPEQLFVDVHIATPYGVTSHLLIPAIGKTGAGGGAATTNPVANWTPNAISVGYVSKGLGITASNPPTVRPADLAIKLTTPVSNVNNADLQLTASIAGTGISADFIIPAVTLSKQQTLTLSSASRDAMIAVVFEKLGPQYDKSFDPTKNAATVTLKSIVLRQDTAVVGTISAKSDLTINWIPANEEKNPSSTQTGKAAGQ